MQSLLSWLLLPSIFCTVCAGIAGYKTGDGPRPGPRSFFWPLLGAVGGGLLWAICSSCVVWIVQRNSSNWGWGYWVYFNFIGVLALSPLPGLVAGLFGFKLRDEKSEKYILGVMAGAFSPYVLFLVSQFHL
jgi:integral membrane sensor domain MASE1